MAILNLEAQLGKVKNRLAYLGIELEGGWNALPAGTGLIRDGSVFRGSNADSLSGFSKYTKVGELPSPILEPIAFPRWLKRFYPQVIDETCGMHVHMSFRDARHYEALMERDYQDTLLYYLKMWGNEVKLPETHCFWDRIAGKSKYCQPTHWPDKQVAITGKDYDQERDGHRYTILNYAWGTHGTIECRVLPMMPTVDIAIQAVRRLLDVTNATLVVMKRKSEGLAGEVYLSNFDKVEEIDERIMETLARRRS